jgi:hypothetical protein
MMKAAPHRPAPCDAPVEAGARRSKQLASAQLARKQMLPHLGALMSCSKSKTFGPLLHCNAVVVIHGASSRRVIPVPRIVIAVFRRSLELIFGDASTIADAEAGIEPEAAHRCWRPHVRDVALTRTTGSSIALVHQMYGALISFPLSRHASRRPSPSVPKRPHLASRLHSSLQRTCV